mmetsp:Transcript_41981/g.127165  ORF Transcript_41981/g.127165 Transcript_41981/m.127165 type:complete len:109 (+) Transcript_41981:62-388(+)
MSGPLPARLSWTTLSILSSQLTGFPQPEYGRGVVALSVVLLPRRGAVVVPAAPSSEQPLWWLLQHQALFSVDHFEGSFSQVKGSRLVEVVDVLVRVLDVVRVVVQPLL